MQQSCCITYSVIHLLFGEAFKTRELTFNRQFCKFQLLKRKIWTVYISLSREEGVILQASKLFFLPSCSLCPHILCYPHTKQNSHPSELLMHMWINLRSAFLKSFTVGYISFLRRTRHIECMRKTNMFR